MELISTSLKQSVRKQGPVLGGTDTLHCTALQIPYIPYIPHIERHTDILYRTTLTPYTALICLPLTLALILCTTSKLCITQHRYLAIHLVLIIELCVHTCSLHCIALNSTLSLSVIRLKWLELLLPDASC